MVDANPEISTTGIFRNPLGDVQGVFHEEFSRPFGASRTNLFTLQENKDDCVSKSRFPQVSPLHVADKQRYTNSQTAGNAPQMMTSSSNISTPFPEDNSLDKPPPPTASTHALAVSDITANLMERLRLQESQCADAVAKYNQALALESSVMAEQEGLRKKLVSLEGTLDELNKESAQLDVDNARLISELSALKMQMPQGGEQPEEASATLKGMRLTQPSDMSVAQVELLDLMARLDRVSVELPAAIQSMNTGGSEVDQYVDNLL